MEWGRNSVLAYCAGCSKAKCEKQRAKATLFQSAAQPGVRPHPPNNFGSLFTLRLGGSVNSVVGLLVF